MSRVHMVVGLAVRAVSRSVWLQRRILACLVFESTPTQQPLRLPQHDASPTPAGFKACRRFS